MNPLRLCDAHNHCQDDWLREHRTRIAADLEQAGVFAAVVNGTCEADWPQVLELARTHSWVRPSVGLHPWDVGNASPAWRESLRRTLTENPRAAVGEIGLDRWMLERARPDDARLAGLRRASMAEQVDALRTQLALAAELGRPATLHCLDAAGALLDVLREGPRIGPGFLLHAYSGPAEMVSAFANLGAYFSFNGSFLDPRQISRQNVFRLIPEDRLLAETDAPAMPLPRERRRYPLPETADGFTINHPAEIAGVYAGLAEIRGQPVDRLAATLERNFARLFGN
jgi:TatD DNase family protein